MSIVDTAKDVYDLMKKGATIEQQEKMMRLREEALELQEENLELRQQNSELQARLNAEHQMQFDGKLYWRNVDGERDGPFCQRCYDGDDKAVRLQSNQRTRNGTTTRLWDCAVCKSKYLR